MQLIPTEDMQALRSVADHYEKAGYEVLIEPAPEQLPFDLNGYQPSLVASKAGNGFIIEVKQSSKRLPIDRFQTIAALVAEKPGWRFLFVTPEENPETPLPGVALDHPTWKEVHNRIDRAKHLAGFGEDEAAFLILWIAFEKALRLKAKDATIPVDLLTPSVMIRHLYSFGELTFSQYETALTCLDAHRWVIHGNHVPKLRTLFKKLYQLCQELCDDNTLT